MGESEIQLNRKVLHNIAQTEPFSFKAVLEVVKEIQGEKAVGKEGAEKKESE